MKPSKRPRWLWAAALTTMADLVVVLLLLQHVRAAELSRGRPIPVAAAAAIAEPRSEVAKEPVAAPERVTGARARWLSPLRRCGIHRGHRFCDGPRRAPVPRGALARVALRAGLGSHAAAAKLLRSRPRPRWVRLVPFARPTTLKWPVRGAAFGRGFGMVESEHGPRLHRGIDLGAARGDPVVAVADGVVAYSDNGIRGYGNLLLILHGGGAVSAYAHLSAIEVTVGDRVRKGQRVGRVGNTGIARGPHLHFQWHVDGHAIDPMPSLIRDR